MELSREQVRQALDCCTHTPRPDCNNCPMGEKRGCVIALLDFALKHYTDILEENEYLKQQNEIYAVLNEKMEHICESYAFQYGTVVPKEVFLKKARESAIKEMHKLIKERCIEGGIYPAFVERTIDNTVKEMLEDADNG